MILLSPTYCSPHLQWTSPQQCNTILGIPHLKKRNTGFGAGYKNLLFHYSFPSLEWSLASSTENQTGKKRSTNRNTSLNYFHTIFISSTVSIKIESRVGLASFYSFLKFFLFIISIFLLERSGDLSSKGMHCDISQASYLLFFWFWLKTMHRLMLGGNDIWN